MSGLVAFDRPSHCARYYLVLKDRFVTFSIRGARDASEEESGP